MQLKHARLYFLIEDEELLKLSDTLFSNVTKLEGKFLFFLAKARPWFDKMALVNKKLPFDIKEYNVYWDQVKNFEAEFEKSTEDVADRMDKDTESFKIRAHHILFGKRQVS